MRRDGVVYYLHTDHLGSTSLTTNANGGVVAQQRYYPYGGVRWSGGTLPTDRRFTGQRWQQSLGLYDYQARHYHPALGRFISADTVVPEPGKPQDLNRYAYGRNNPLRHVDPTGHGVVLPPALKIDISEWSKWAVGALRAALFVLGGQTSVENDTLKVEPSMAIPCGADFIVAAPAAAAASRLADVADDAVGQFADDVADDALRAAEEIANPLPRTRRFARAVPERVARDIEAGLDDVYLAKPGDPDAFITAAEDLARYRTQLSVERRLGLSPGRRAVVTFKYDPEVGGIASPIRRSYPEFVGGGRTIGGAREWVIPNRPLNELPIWDIKIRYLK